VFTNIEYGGVYMDIANMQLWQGAFQFFSEYIVTKGVDLLVDLGSKRTNEMTIEEHIYSVFTDSLEKFCSVYDFEFNPNAFNEALSYSVDYVQDLSCDKYLKRVFQKATGLELTDEECSEWIRIIEDNIVSDKHEKLVRAIFIHSIKGDESKLIQPVWMKEHMADNYLQVAFDDEEKLNVIFDRIKTSLSEECWTCTKELLLELLLNAYEHGNATKASLYVDEKKLSLIDDGNVFNPLLLVTRECERSGGTWTIKHFMSIYQDVKVYYEQKNDNNITTIEFPESMFNVNLLCEVKLHPAGRRKRNYECKPCFPESNAKYYYIDFSDETARVLFCMSLAMGMVDGLDEFCRKTKSKVFVYVPNVEKCKYVVERLTYAMMGKDNLRLVLE
jgi:hypothetical protein